MKLLTHSPEGVSFRVTLAGPSSRFLAWFIDAVIAQAIVIGLSQVLTVFLVFDPDGIVAFYILMAFCINFGYTITLEHFWKGQTVGKRVLRIQVMDAGALPLTFSQILVRNALRAVDSLPYFYFVGGLSIFWTKKAQRLGDLAAHTIVVRHEKKNDFDFTQAQSGKFNSMKSHSRQCGKLRQTTPPEVAGLALQSLLRRNQLSDSARLEVFGKIRADLESHAPFPEESTLGLTDEQYVRNAVEILFEQRGAYAKQAPKSAT